LLHVCCCVVVGMNVRVCNFDTGGKIVIAKKAFLDKKTTSVY